MSNSGHYRAGHLDRQLDGKGRFSLPVDWRPPAGENVYFIKVSVEKVPALRVFTKDAFDRKLRDIETAASLSSAQRDRARGILFGSAIESKVNDQGKLTIPKALAESQGLELPGAVRLVGRGELFEILTPANGRALEAAEEKVRQSDSSLSEVLGF